MQCRNCGNEIPYNSAVCPVCGVNLQTGQPQPQYQQAPQQPQPQYQQAPQQPNMGYQQPPQQFGPYSSMVSTAVNDAKTAKILGILSIVLCAGIGWILAIVALVKAKKIPNADVSMLTQQEMFNYNQALNNFKTGKTCAIIGLVLTVLVVIITFVVNFIGATALYYYS